MFASSKRKFDDCLVAASKKASQPRMGDRWWDNITLCEAGGHNFTQTTSTGLEFRCIVHDICKRPALSHNVRRDAPPARTRLTYSSPTPTPPRARTLTLTLTLAWPVARSRTCWGSQSR